MKFIDYINERIKDEEEFDAVIGGVDMPATFGFCDDWVITDYCKEKYGAGNHPTPYRRNREQHLP